MPPVWIASYVFYHLFTCFRFKSLYVIMVNSITDFNGSSYRQCRLCSGNCERDRDAFEEYYHTQPFFWTCISLQLLKNVSTGRLKKRLKWVVSNQFVENGWAKEKGFRTFRQKTFRQKHGGGHFGKQNAETSQAENICRNVSYNMWGISGVCTLALTVAKTSSHYDGFAISVPARSLLLFDLA